jgi:hypothetical protein
MRAAAVALVLILGAAVVLWYGNLLNSWVLGGLVGGLAALLLSIPISLAIFSYFSHRQDERLKAEAEEDQFLGSPQAYYYQDIPPGYELALAQLPPAEEEWSEEEEYSDDRHVTTARNLPVPSYPRVPMQRERQHLLPVQSIQQRQRVNDQLLAHERRANVSQAQMSGGRPTPPRRPAPGHQTYYPGFYGHQLRSQRGQQQTAALRVAREEAARRQYAARHQEDWDTPLTPTSKKLPAVRSERSIERSTYQQGASASSRRLPSQQTSSQPNQYRSRRTVEGSTVPPRTGRMLPSANGANRENAATGNRYSGGLQRANEPSTEQLGGKYPSTEQLGGKQFRPPFGQTGQVTRNPHIEAQNHNPDLMTGTLKKPLVRRAPYMYEDDPLLHELAQQIEAPAVRRSSRQVPFDQKQ